ncbi:MAG TPA: YafY family protein [Spirochaetota bacterium]|jgi:predicted DNA-binding transcriptional regulator YafY|nr:YafY family protein [Spirochaetota bacterium]HPM33171.1 YafY family protein [Spirochaetota bacterium]HPY01956.1 YafY family protein [Spirochaetota bacterium]HQA51467.1 YafY family protein [Spirochaetota bacterium]
MKLDRLLSIVVILLNKDRVSAKELASRFEVTTRTIYRDIDSINMAGIPIISYPGNDGGFGIMENFRLERHIFTEEDIIEVLSALKGMTGLIQSERIRSAADKFANMIEGKKNTDFFDDGIIIDINPWGSKSRIDSDFRTIYSAILSRKKLSFSYSDYNGKCSSRTVEPISLVFKAYSWYLYSYCLERNDYRIFRLSRIKKISVLKDTFTGKKKKYQSDYSIKPDTDITIRFKNSFETLISEFFPQSRIEKSADFSTITFKAQNEEWLYKILLGMGRDIEIVSPKSVRESFIKYLKEISSKYSST